MSRLGDLVIEHGPYAPHEVQRGVVDMTNPLGLTDEQLAWSDAAAWWRDLAGRVARTRAEVEALPPGTKIKITLYGISYPEMTREQVLGVML